MRQIPLLVAAPLLVGSLLGCPPTKEDKPLPPSGLAGNPSGPGAANPGAQLPSGHPPIDAAAQAHAAAGIGQDQAGGDPAAAVNDLKLTGKVLEVLEVPQYTYMRLNTPGGEVWAAVSKASIKVGDEVAIAQPMVMEDFPSRALNRTFPKLIMGSLVDGAKAAEPAKADHPAQADHPAKADHPAAPAAPATPG